MYPDTGAFVTYVKSNTKLTNKKPSAEMKIGSCFNHILHSTTQQELPLQGLPTKARTKHKVDGININLLSIGTVCDQKCVRVFKEKEVFTAHKNNVEMKLNRDQMVTGIRRGEEYNCLWKIPLLSTIYGTIARNGKTKYL